MTKLRLGALVIVLSLGSGCGGSGIGSSTAATEFCHSMVDEMVDAVARCYSGPDLSWRDTYTGSVPCDQVDGLLAAGTLTYDRASGADCLTRLSQMECIYTDWPQSCTNALAGSLAAGSQCSYLADRLFSDCAPGNYCSHTGNACGGICKPYVQPGGSCAITDAGEIPGCASGSSCHLDSKLCVPYVGDGQPCQEPNQCGDGLYCDWHTTGTCHKRKTSGTCTYRSECAAGNVCTGLAYAKTCTRAKLPGDSCTQGQSECYGLSFCDDNGKCTRTGVAENQPCGTKLQGEYIQCGTDLYCARGMSSSGAMVEPATCQKSKPTGSNCSYSLQCAGISAYCDLTTGLCATCGGTTATGGAIGLGGAGGATAGTGGAAGGAGSGGSTATDGVACPLPTKALITDFTYTPVDGGATDSVHFGDSTTLAGSTYVYPTSGRYPVTSDATQDNWHISGTLGDYSGFGLNLDNCSRVDASAYLGIQFTISGSVPQGNIVTFGMGTLNDTITSAWLNDAHAGDGSVKPGRCVPTSGTNKYDQSTCADAQKDIPVTATPTVVGVLWSDFTGGKPEAGVTPTDIISIYWYFPPPAGIGTPAVATYPVDIVIDDLQFIQFITP